MEREGRKKSGGEYEEEWNREAVESKEKVELKKFA